MAAMQAAPRSRDRSGVKVPAECSCVQSAAVGALLVASPPEVLPLIHDAQSTPEPAAITITPAAVNAEIAIFRLQVSRAAKALRCPMEKSLPTLHSIASSEPTVLSNHRLGITQRDPTGTEDVRVACPSFRGVKPTQEREPRCSRADTCFACTRCTLERHR